MKRNSLPIYVRLALVPAILAGWFGASPAHAQAPLSLDALKIQLWPEYDQPSMLVIITGTLSPQVVLPAEVTVRIPLAVGQPSAAAVLNAEGQLIETSYTTTPTDDWVFVTLQASTNTFHLEYYDASLVRSGNQRRFLFNWAADSPARSVSVQVQVPVNATGMQFQPTLASIGAGPFGLDYYGADIGSLAAGQSVNLELEYQKADATLSAEVVAPVEPLVPGVAPAQAPLWQQPWLIALAAVAVVAIVAGAGYLVWTGQRRRPPARRSRPRARGSAIDSGAAAGGDFCTQCGTARLPGDRYCRSCGASLD